LPLAGRTARFADKCTRFYAVNVDVAGHVLGAAVIVADAQSVSAGINSIYAIGNFAGGAVGEIYITRIAKARHSGSDCAVKRAQAVLIL